MKAKARRPAAILTACVIGGCGVGASGEQASTESSDHDFRLVGEAVVRLLETKNVAKFADEIVPTLEDWQAVRSTASIAKDDPIGPAFQKQLGRDRRSVEASAQRTLEKAKALGLGPAQVKFKVKEISAKHIGESQVPGFGPLSWVPEAEVVLVGEPQSAEGEKLRGEYRLALGSMRGGLKLPRGWRFSDGVRWKSFPPGVADRKTESELNILNKVYAEHRLSLVDDPALEVLQIW